MAKKLDTSLKNWDDIDAALLKIGKATSRVQAAEAAYNTQIQNLRQIVDENTAADRTEIAGLESEIENFCLINKDQFEATRSREMMHGSVSFRTTPPKVALLNRKYSWDTVLELLKKFKWAAQFVRTKEEPDKESILTAHAAKEIDDTKLASVGLAIQQTEKFGYDIKWDAIGE